MGSRKRSQASTRTPSRVQVSPSYLVCPQCLELLTREDIEGFGHCPYCDYLFELDQDLEDFLLRPVVQQWVRQARAQAGDDTAF